MPVIAYGHNRMTVNSKFCGFPFEEMRTECLNTRLPCCYMRDIAEAEKRKE